MLSKKNIQDRFTDAKVQYKEKREKILNNSIEHRTSGNQEAKEKKQRTIFFRCVCVC